MEKVVHDAEWEARRAEFLQRFRAAKERKRQRVAEMEAYLEEYHRRKYGEESKYVN